MRPAIRIGAALLMIAGSLAGCKYYWTKPGATYEQFDRDSRECALQTAPNPTAASHGAVDMQAYRACLRQRGYIREETANPPSDAWRGFE